MKLGIGYAIWNRNALEWLIEGLLESCPSIRTAWAFIDNDAEHELFLTLQHRLPIVPKIINYHGPDISEGQQHNLLIQWGFDEKLDMVLCPQDDNRVKDPALADNLAKLFDKYGDKLGIVGGRDMYGPGYAGMASCPHSLSVLATRRIGIGETCVGMPLMNTGPFAYPMRCMGTIGLHDSNLIYGHDDITLRADLAGFTNVLLGMDIIHEHKATPRAVTYTTARVTQCVEQINAKFFNQIGRNVI